MLIVLEFVEFDCVSYVREEHVLVFFPKKNNEMQLKKYKFNYLI